ncbi:MAG: LysM peptidoglycan-binding domain-containing protein [Anaerolineae bacterium]|nr:LysM peptidoglycan-binding domain-containing protein [Anaerolineae bacterium]
MRMAFAVLLIASLLALAVFWVILELQRNNPNPPTVEQPVADAGAVVFPTDRRIEQLFVDGSFVQLEVLFSKDIITEAEWNSLNQVPAPQTELPPPVDIAQAQPPPEPTPIAPDFTAPTAVVVQPAVAVPAAVDKVIFKEYTVMPGDSLYSIARANNSSIELMALHGIAANQMVPGTVLPRLPYANPAYCPGYTAYVVRDHDTVFSIARTRGTTVAIIAQLNRLDANYTIFAADVICVP